MQYYYPLSAALLPSFFPHTEFELVPLLYTDKQQVSYFL